MKIMTGYGDYPSAPAPPPGGYGPPSGSGQELSGWWRRVGATIVDGIITGVIGTLIALAVGNNTGSRFGFDTLISLIYTVALLGSRGRTVGNLTVGTQVVPIEGGPLGYGKAFVRWLIQTILQVTVIGGLLDVLWPLWDERNQTLHDKVVSTLVVKV
jgi:uncharacterized RDD family membrane protein YckC